MKSYPGRFMFPSSACKPFSLTHFFINLTLVDVVLKPWFVFLRCLWRLPGNSFFSCYKRVCSWNSFGFNNPHIMLSVVSFVCKRWLDAHGCRFTGLNQWKDRQTKGRTDGRTDRRADEKREVWSTLICDLLWKVEKSVRCQVLFNN